MLLETIYLKQTHLILRDVDGSEVSVTLEDALDLYAYIKDHLQEIEEQSKVNWQEFIASIDQARSNSVE
jgi:predicted DNA-binding ribbon-helix-helix protein